MKVSKLFTLKVPISLGIVLAKLPYEVRPIIGRTYTKSKEDIEVYEKLPLHKRRSYIYEKTYGIVKYAINNIPFYKEFYATNGFRLSDLICFEDISKIPVVHKKDLMSSPLEFRSNISQNSRLVNTGGSSGNPLSFYKPNYLWGHEWAHLHYIWEKVGFKRTDLKLVITGRSSVRNLVDYDFPRNSLMIDLYTPFVVISATLKKYLHKYECKYIHGYPSAIYELALFCESKDTQLRDLLRSKLKYAILNSEYPHPLYREKIEEVFGIETFSFYGHTEGCVLAYEEREKYIFNTSQTYGYSEAIPANDGASYLIGTSYYNLEAPLIRYNTEDLISNILNEGDILTSFRILYGRSGEFVLDKMGKKISLTGLIFGRHHKLFEYCTYIQTAQNEIGKVMVLFVAKPEVANEFEPSLLFDSSNIFMDFLFKRMPAPIKTPNGKINLLVPYQD